MTIIEDMKEFSEKFNVWIPTEEEKALLREYCMKIGRIYVLHDMYFRTGLFPDEDIARISYGDNINKVNENMDPCLKAFFDRGDAEIEGLLAQLPEDLRYK